VGRSPIFSAKVNNKQIGYTEDVCAFDLSGHKRCNYNPNTGNLHDLDSGRIIGHLSLAGRFVGLSYVADELFPEPSTAKLQATSSEATTVFTAPNAVSHRSPDGPIAPATSFTELAGPNWEALAPCRDEPALTDSAVPTAVSDETSPNDSTAPTPSANPAAPHCKALAPCRDESGGVDSAAPAAVSYETSRNGSIAPATSSTKLPAAECVPLSASPVSIAHDSPTVPTSADGPLDFAASATSSDKFAKARQNGSLPIDVEQQMREIIRLASAMKVVEPRRNAVKDIAIQMRERIAALRRQRSQARTINRVP